MSLRKWLSISVMIVILLSAGNTFAQDDHDHNDDDHAGQFDVFDFIHENSGHTMGSCMDVEPNESGAIEFVQQTLADAAKYEDYNTAVEEGYTPLRLRGAENGRVPVHYINRQYLRDDVSLDGSQPESLIYIYDVDAESYVFLGVMFIEPTSDTTCPGGSLTTWHYHEFANTNSSRRGGRIFDFEQREMIHVWNVGEDWQLALQHSVDQSLIDTILGTD